MKKTEIDMAVFLEALKAPQSRRILEKLATKEMTFEALARNTKLSQSSIQLHLESLIAAKLVSKSRDGVLKFNKKKFKEFSEWFSKL